MEKIYPSKESTHFIFCDDIRMEVGNKPSIMGWYSNNDILFNPKMEKMAIPFSVAFIAYDGEGEYECKFEIENPDGEVKIKQELGKNTKKPNKAMLVLNKFTILEFRKEGIYKVRVFLDDNVYESNLKIVRAEQDKL